MHRVSRLSSAIWLTAAGLTMVAPTVARAAQPGRAYEMVSPVDKAGNDVNPVVSAQASPDGGRVLFGASNGFPGAATSTAGSNYVAGRGERNWETIPVEPPSSNQFSQILNTTSAANPQVGKFLQTSLRALAPGAAEGGGNVYVLDSASGTRTLLATGGASLFDSFASPGARPFAGATADFSTVLFQTSTRLLPDALSGPTNVYKWSAAEGLSLVSVLPDGTAEPFGANANAPELTHSPGALSADGTRAVFAGNSTGGLYLREGNVTTPITVSQRPGDPTTSQPALFVSMTPDGQHVFFIGLTALTADATGGSELYRYDVESGRLTDLTPATDPADSSGQVFRVQSVDESGNHVYFVSAANLARGGRSGSPNLYYWSDGETRFVAELEPFSEGFGPIRWGTSPNGRFLEFMSFASVTGYDNTSPACRANPIYGNAAGVCSEVYIYDADRDEVRCASCLPGGSNGHSELSGVAGLISNYYGRVMLNDGRAFFNSDDSLVAEDTNGRTDVYEWNGARAELVSTGKSDTASTFADASVDGSDIFFFTSEQLVKQDVDHLIDVYDARLGDGLPEQNQDPLVKSCDGAGCQGDPGDPSVLPSLGSVKFDGAGNVADDDGSLVQRKMRVGRASVSGRSAKLTVRVPAAGRVTVSGPLIRSAKKDASKAGLLKMKVTLNKPALRALRSKKRINVAIRVRYAPTRGSSSTARVSAAFEARRA